MERSNSIKANKLLGTNAPASPRTGGGEAKLAAILGGLDAGAGGSISEAPAPRGIYIKPTGDTVDAETRGRNQLELTVELYIEAAKEKNVLAPEEIQSIFLNLDLLAFVHEKFLRALDETFRDAPEPMVGECLQSLQKSGFLKHYKEYCAKYSLATEALRKTMKKNNKARKLFEDPEKRKRVKGLDLESLLIKPVQRMMKYPLLLSELIKRTKEGHPDLENLVNMREQLQDIVDRVNEAKRTNVGALSDYDMKGLQQEAVAKLNRPNCTASDLEDAKKILLQLHRAKPKHAGILYNICIADTKLGNFDAALKSLSDAISNGFNNVNKLVSDDEIEELRNKRAHQFSMLVKEAKRPQSAFARRSLSLVRSLSLRKKDSVSSGLSSPRSSGQRSATRSTPPASPMMRSQSARNSPGLPSVGVGALPPSSQDDSSEKEDLKKEFFAAPSLSSPNLLSPRSLSNQAAISEDQLSTSAADEVVSFARCIAKYEADDDGELPLVVGDIIAVYIQDADGWWKGERIRPEDNERASAGYFPMENCAVLEGVSSSNVQQWLASH